MKNEKINQLTLEAISDMDKVLNSFTLEASETPIMNELQAAINVLNDEESLRNYNHVIELIEELHLIMLSITNHCYKLKADEMTALKYETKTVILAEMLNNYRNMCHYYRELKKLKSMNVRLHCDLIVGMNIHE